MTEAGSLIRSLSGRPAARNFHAFVINEIGLGIVSGRFAIGSVLPNDAMMMDTYGVSRTVLREALKTLEAKGLVEARPKVGTRVAPRSRWNVFDPQVLSWHFETELERDYCESLFDIRLLMERRAVTLAAQYRNAEQVRIFKYWVHQMDISSDSAEAHALAALEVHRILAEASQNPFLRPVVGVVELTLALAATAGTDAERQAFRQASTQEHETLQDAIEQGDSTAAIESLERDVSATFALSLKKLD